MTAGERLGLVGILGDPVRLDEMLADMQALQALYRRFRRPAPQASMTMPQAAARTTPAPPGLETAGLLIRKPDGKGGWRHQLVPGAALFGDDARARDEGRLTTHPLDAATYAAGLDAAVACLFGGGATQARHPPITPSPTEQIEVTT